jgi:hypothetical protein
MAQGDRESMRCVGPGARVALLSAFALASSGARADVDAGTFPGNLRATVVCDQPAAPGRLRCDVEARGKQGTLRWADVEIVKAPGFIAPLRGRAGPRDATTRENDLWRWSLGLVSRERGEGDVTARVRAVVCEGEVCTPEEVVALGHVKVGP